MEADSRILEDLSWTGIEGLLGGAELIDGMARSHGALVRRREIRDGSQLLRLGLAYASQGRSLRSAAAWGASALGVGISDVSLMERLQGSGDFLAAVCGDLLRLATAGSDANPLWRGAPVRLVDSSVFAGPGKTGGQLRLHASYDPALGRFSGFDLSAIRKGESLRHTGIEAGAVYLADRNYARTRDLRQLEETKAFYAIRAGIRSMRMLDAATGARLTGKAVLARLGEAGQIEIDVRLIKAKARKADQDRPLKARLLVFKAGPAAAARETARIERSRTRHGVTPNAETATLAGIVMIVTNLSAQAWPAAAVTELYRLRWQIELAFKTLKSTFRMRDVPAKEPDLARAWILANLAAALLANLLASAIERAVPPSTVKSGKASAPQAAASRQTLHPANPRRRSR